MTYSYDGLGRRIEKNVSGVITKYIYDGEDILMEYGSTDSPQVNVLQAYYTHGAGIDEPLSMARDLNQNGTFESTEHFFYHTDALGSITAITDSTGIFIESYQYDSFGNPTIFDSTNAVIPESLIGNPYLFTGREFDSESGLYYLRSRYYDPSIGRFISEDPVSGNLNNPQTLNKYTYVVNSPINGVDPFGEAAVLEIFRRLLLGRLGSFLGSKLVGRELSTEAFVRNVPTEVKLQATIKNPGGDDDGDGIPNGQDPRPFIPDPSIGPIQGAPVCLFPT